jgi:capsid protein
MNLKDMFTLPSVNIFGKKEIQANNEAEIISINRESESNPIAVVKKEEISAVRYGGVWSSSFDGEKNFGEIGPIKRYILDYHALSLRSWQSYLESDISKTVIDRYCIWVIDKGLKLQCSPVTKVLQSEGIKIESEDFNDMVEARFSIWAKSNKASYNGMLPFNSISKEAFKNAKIGGDCLVILRLVDGVVKVQLIDGAHLSSPFGSVAKSGNKIVDGVEIDANGKHLKYYIKKPNGDFSEVEAWSESTGLRMAYLVYGSKYRLDNVRGVPTIATSLETLKKIDRYKEAAVGSAEERQKIALFIEHDLNSDGSNPFADNLASMLGDKENDAYPVDDAGNVLANKIAVTTNKSAFNLTQGAKIKSIESKQELTFPEFYSTNANIVCASIGIPPNVAFSLYNDSFSASRAATKDWEHTITVERDDFYNQFYSNVYALWFHVEVLKFKIIAPGYLQAFVKGDFMIIESYLNCRFTGPMFPHIDPVKEVEAARLRLGKSGDHLALSTAEAETENLMSGDYNSNIEQFAKELEKSNKLGVKAPEETAPSSVVAKE